MALPVTTLLTIALPPRNFFSRLTQPNNTQHTVRLAKENDDNAVAAEEPVFQNNVSIPGIKSWRGRGENKHLADEPVLVYRTALLAVRHGRLGPHLLLCAGEGQYAVTAWIGGQETYHVLEDHVAMPIKGLYAGEPGREHVS